MAIANTDGNIVVGTTVDTSGINEGMAKIKSQLSSLGRLATLGVIGKKLIDLGKSATMAASDLAEVNNVVFTGFGGQEGYDMVNKFCNNCVEKFGLTEYAAKNMAGAFANMGSALGLSQKNANNMALNLTALAGDMSSFYNISEDYARVALSAVYTGETETLKRYGIVLTEANLQQYALQQGLTANYRTLDSASKTYVRYMYVMDKTQGIQHDFEQTNMSFANSVRILKQEWNNLMIAMGGFIKTVAAPIIRGLTAIVRAFTQAFQVIYNTIHSMFGFTIDWGDKFKKDSVGISSGLGGAADNASNLGDNLKSTGTKASKATKKVKELNKTLQGFDKLNNLTTSEKGGTGGGGGGSGAGGLGGLDIPDIPLAMKLDGKKKKLPKFNSMYDLGRWISNGIADSLNKINWNKIKKKARFIATQLADLLNGLTNPKMFKAFGHTLAQGLNTALEFLYTFAKKYDWKQLGQALGDGVNQFFTEFDFKKFGKTVKVWVQGILKAIDTFVHTVDWGKVLKGIGDFFKGLGPDGLFDLIKLIFLVKSFKLALKTARDLIVKGITGAWVEPILKKIGIGFTSLGSNIFGKKGLMGGFKTMWGNLFNGGMGMDAEGKALGESGNIFFKLGTKLADKVVTGFGVVESGIKGVLSKVGKNVSSFFKGGVTTETMTTPGTDLAMPGSLGAGSAKEVTIIDAEMNSVLQTLNNISGVIAIISGSVMGVVSFIGMWKDGFSAAREAVMLVGTAVVVVGAIILGAAAWPAIIVGAIVAGIATVVILIHDNWDTVKKWFAGLGKKIATFFSNIWSAIKEFFSPVVEFFQGIWDGIVNVFSDVVNFFGNIFTQVGDFFQTVWDGISSVVSGVVDFFAGVWDTLWTNVLQPIAGFFNTYIIQPIVNFVQGFVKRIQQFAEGCWLIIQAIWKIVSGWFYDHIIQPIVGFVQTCVTTIENFVQAAWGVIQTIWHGITSFFNTYIIQPIVEFVQTCVEAVEHAIQTAWNTIRHIWNVIATWFNAHIIQPIIRFVRAAVTTVQTLVRTLVQAVQRIVGTVANWINQHVLQPIVRFVRTVVRTIQQLVTGLWNGIRRVWGAVAGWFNVHIFTPIRNGFRILTSAVARLFTNLWNGIRNGVRAAFNFVLRIVESAVNFLINGINAPIRAFNRVGKWAGKVVGKDYGGVDLVPKVHIPRLASGAVIPPNKEFLAVLGDQKKGTNIETPLSTMVQAFNTALKQNGGTGNNELMSQMIIAMNQQTELLKTIASKNLSIGDREVFNSVKRSAYDYSMRTGKKAF